MNLAQAKELIFTRGLFSDNLESTAPFIKLHADSVHILKELVYHFGGRFKCLTWECRSENTYKQFIEEARRLQRTISYYKPIASTERGKSKRETSSP